MNNSVVIAQLSPEDYEAIINDAPVYSDTDPEAIVQETCVSASEIIQGVPTLASFVDRYGQIAKNVGVNNGIPFETILAQAILESDYGRSELAVNANNFFGIKAGSDWSGPVYKSPTKEEQNGVLVDVVASFRQYANAEEGFQGYADFIISRPYYQDALQHPNDPYRYLELLVDQDEPGELKYATDSNYVQKVSPVIDQVINHINTNGLGTSSGTGGGTCDAVDGVIVGNDITIIDTSDDRKTGFPERSTKLREVRGFIYHYTAGDYGSRDPEGVVNVLRCRGNSLCNSSNYSTFSGLSVQYYISQEGDIYQLTTDSDIRAGHACTANAVTIGVEIEGRNESELLNNPKVIEASIKLGVYILGKHPSIDPFISDPTRFSGLLGHLETDPYTSCNSGKIDPGPNFLNLVRDSVRDNIRNGNSANTSCPSGVSSDALYTNHCAILNQIINLDPQRFEDRKLDRIANSRLIDESNTTIVDGVRIASSALSQYNNLKNAALSDGVTLQPVSGYRTFEDQVLQRIEFCSNNQNDISYDRIMLQTGSGTCTVPVALPGNSNHNGGTAVDFGVNGVTDDCGFKNTQQYTWLIANASGYGFRTIGSGSCNTGGSEEPWHWEII